MNNDKIGWKRWAGYILSRVIVFLVLIWIYQHYAHSQEVKQVPQAQQLELLKLQHSVDEMEKADKDLFGRLAYYQVQCPTFKQIIDANNAMPGSKAAVDSAKVKLNVAIEKMVRDNKLDSKIWTINIDTMEFEKLPKTEEKK